MLRHCLKIGTIVVKHANPSGVSIEPDHLKSYLSAINCDPKCFWGILACNYKVNFKIAKRYKNYYEVIIADEYEAKVKVVQSKNLRLIDSSKIKIKNETK